MSTRPTPNFKTVCKKARADLGEYVVDEIKLGIKTGDPEKAKKVRERMDREARVMRWMGVPIGVQGSLFDEDRRTAGDIAEEEGFSAGSDQTTPKKPPEKYGVTGENAQRWMRGFDRAQDALFKAFEKRGTPVLRSADGDTLTPKDGPHDPRIAEAEAMKEEGEDKGETDQDFGDQSEATDPLDDSVTD